jgi:hypothetical protein
MRLSGLGSRRTKAEMIRDMAAVGTSHARLCGWFQAAALWARMRRAALACVLAAMILATAASQSARGRRGEHSDLGTTVVAAARGESEQASAPPVLSAAWTTRAVGALLPSAESRERLELASYTRVAVMRVEFEEPLLFEKQGVLCALNDSSPDCADAATGMMRLLCGHTLFETHPPRGRTPTSSGLPLHLLPWSQISQMPLVGLTEREWDTRDQDRILRAALVMTHSELIGGKRVVTRNVDRELLSSCLLKLLPSHSQSWRPFGRWLDSRGRPVSATVRFSQWTWQESTCEAEKDGPLSGEPHVPGSLHKAAAQSLADAALERRLWGEQDRRSTEMLELATGVKFVGVVKGLTTAVSAPVADLMGSVIGDALSATVIEPVVQMVVGPLAEHITSGVQPGVTAWTIDQVTPSLTDTVTSALIALLQNYLCEDFIPENLTPRMTVDLTKKLTDSLVPKIKSRLSTEGVTQMARKVTLSTTHVLGKSIPHALVGALTHSLTHNPVVDYFCYYCHTKKEYCEFCQRSVAPQQFYYAMYYAGYYSMYYSNYFTEQSSLGVRIVQPKEPDFEDPSSFGAQE